MPKPRRPIRAASCSGLHAAPAQGRHTPTAKDYGKADGASLQEGSHASDPEFKSPLNKTLLARTGLKSSPSKLWPCGAARSSPTNSGIAPAPHGRPPAPAKNGSCQSLASDATLSKCAVHTCAYTHGGCIFLQPRRGRCIPKCGAPKLKPRLRSSSLTVVFIDTPTRHSALTADPDGVPEQLEAKADQIAPPHGKPVRNVHRKSENDNGPSAL